MITLDAYQLKALLMETARVAAKEVLSENGLLKDEISQRRAWEIYGRGNIESLRNRGLITRTGGLGRNSKCTYKRSEIDAVIMTQRHFKRGV